MYGNDVISHVTISELGSFLLLWLEFIYELKTNSIFKNNQFTFAI